MVSLVMLSLEFLYKTTGTGVLCSLGSVELKINLYNHYLVIEKRLLSWHCNTTTYTLF